MLITQPHRERKDIAVAFTTVASGEPESALVLTLTLHSAMITVNQRSRSPQKYWHAGIFVV